MDNIIKIEVNLYLLIELSKPPVFMLDQVIEAMVDSFVIMTGEKPKVIILPGQLFAAGSFRGIPIKTYYGIKEIAVCNEA